MTDTRSDLPTAPWTAKPHFAHFGEALVFGGNVEPHVHLDAIIRTTQDPCVLVHLRRPVASPREIEHRSLKRAVLMTDPRHLFLDHERPIAGLAVPRMLLGVGALDGIVDLPDTAVVRASRVLLESLLREYGTCAGDVLHEKGVDGLLLAIMKAAVDASPRPIPLVPLDAPLYLRLLAVIDARHRDPAVDVSMLADELHISKRQLYRAVPGDGVAALLTRRRLATARRLLREAPELTITEVAHSAGFSRAAQMRAAFVRDTGLSPTEFRQRIAHTADAVSVSG